MFQKTQIIPLFFYARTIEIVKAYKPEGELVVWREKLLDFSFLISILISVTALSLSLYREFKGPDISLLNKKPTFKLTDKEFEKSEEYIPQWFYLREISLVFANYGGKGGTIVDLQIDFTPIKAFEEFFQESWCYPIELPITLEEGENHTVTFDRFFLKTINWKKFPLAKILQRNQNVGKAIDEAIADGKNKFERFVNLLTENEELGKVSCTASLTRGRLWTKVGDKKLFENVSVIHEYRETFDLLRKSLQNWDQMRPTRSELIMEFLNPIRNLVSELNTNHEILMHLVTEENITKSRLRTDIWKNLSKTRRYDEIRWFLIDQETNLKKNLEELYREISKYNTKIQRLLYLGENRTEEDFDPLNKQRAKLYEENQKLLKRVNGILVAQSV